MLAIGLTLVYLSEAIQWWLLVWARGKELDEPFTAEVMYQGRAVADLSDRRFDDMFWFDYQITPRSGEEEHVGNDDLWDSCVFYFRDPRSGHLCTSGFVGGGRPFIKEGRILLRAMYFGGKDNQLEPRHLPTPNP